MMRASWRALSACAVVVSTIAVPARAASAFVARPCASGQTHVAVVVDMGSGSSVTSLCVAVDAHDNGALALAKRASMLGRPQPRYNNSGLLCAIDGFPANGCGEQNGDGSYSYWAYFHGANGSWTYANGGPAAQRVDAGVVEGWRFEPHGAANATDPPPRGSAQAAQICVAATPPVAGNGSAGTPAPPAQSQPAGNGATATTTAGASAGKPAGAGPATTRVNASSTSAARGTTPSSSFFDGSGVAARSPARHSSGPPVGLFAGLALVAGLATAGVVVARRRSSAAR